MTGVLLEAGTSTNKHRFYAEIVINIKTHKRTTQKTKKMSNTDPTKKKKKRGDLRGLGRISSSCF
jgi:hypothetical protein